VAAGRDEAVDLLGGLCVALLRNFPVVFVGRSNVGVAAALGRHVIVHPRQRLQLKGRVPQRVHAMLDRKAVGVVARRARGFLGLGGGFPQQRTPPTAREIAATNRLALGRRKYELAAHAAFNVFAQQGLRLRNQGPPCVDVARGIVEPARGGALRVARPSCVSVRSRYARTRATGPPVL
jgi:hypothetical protein